MTSGGLLEVKQPVKTGAKAPPYLAHIVLVIYCMCAIKVQEASVLLYFFIVLFRSAALNIEVIVHCVTGK